MKFFAFQLTLILLSLLFTFGSSPSWSKEASKTEKESSVKSIPVKVVEIAKSPVSIVSARAELDLDDYGSPVNARMYIKYKNIGESPLAAVRFRLNYLDKQGKEIGFFHAPHAAIVSPNCSAEGKWSGQINPALSTIKVSPLLVRFPDGKDWKSKKMIEIEQERKGLKLRGAKKIIE